MVVLRHGTRYTFPSTCANARVLISCVSSSIPSTQDRSTGTAISTQDPNASTSTST